VTVPSGGGGGLTGTSGNGLTVTATSVSLAIANTSSAGAMPILSGNSAQYLSGTGTWLNVPSGGGVTSVTSGNSAVLTVSPTTGNVVITPNGFGGSFTPSFNVGTKTLSVPNTTHNGGILTTQGTTFIDLSSLSSSLPSGTTGDFLYNNGTNWLPSGTLKFTPGTPSVLANSSSPAGNGVQFFAAATGLYNTNSFLYGTAGAGISAPFIEFTGISNGSIYMNIGGGSPEGGATSEPNAIVFGNAGAKHGFFGKFPVARPSTTNDITSVRNALIALGLIS